MPRYLTSESAEAILGALSDALDLLDFAIVLLDRDLRVQFMNRRFTEIWNVQPAFLATAPTFRELLDYAAANEWYALPAADVPAYLDAREAEVRAGSIPPARINRADRRHLRFRCFACADGGRILTYTDISQELDSETSDDMTRVSAELRFNSEMLEEQGAHLATLAEGAEDNARKAEAACLLLEHEVAERRQLETKLRHLATTDGLTGILNRAELLASAQRAIEKDLRTRQKLVVLMIDVDHFKAINDRFGHAGGDSALRHLVGLLRAGTRQIDLLGRLGGEEFCVVLTDTPSAPAEGVAERLRAQVAELPTVFGDRPIPMTISVGLAIQLETETTIEQVIARADDALYRAKRTGRNRVVEDQRPAAA